MRNRWLRFGKDESGGVAVVCAVGLLVFLGMGALVVDLGHGYLVRREMQKAAESGANAGATGIFPLQADGKTRLADPQWASAKTAAVNAVKLNYADTVILNDFSEANVEVGYWDRTWVNGIPQNAPANGHLLGYANPGAYVPTTPPEYPAVKVSLAKTAGGTGTSAPMSTFLASVMGVNSMQVAASAVAARFYPSSIKNAFPFALPKAFFHTDEHGVLTPNQTTFNVSNTDPTQPGQWTTFGSQTNGSNYINGLILGANTTLTLNNQIWIPTGVKSDVYNTIVNNCIYNPATNSPIYMAAVAEVPGSSSLTTGNWATVDGFVGIKVTYCTGSGSGGNPYVTCQWVPNYVDPNASGTGPAYSDPLPPKMVQ